MATHNNDGSKRTPDPIDAVIETYTELAAIIEEYRANVIRELIRHLSLPDRESAGEAPANCNPGYN